MEYDQAETVEFTNKRGRLFYIGRYALVFLLFGIVCVSSTYWFLNATKRFPHEEKEMSIKKSVDEGPQSLSPFLASEKISEIKTEILEMNSRLSLLEKNIREEYSRLENLGIEASKAIGLSEDLQQSVGLVEKEVQALKVERRDAQIEQSIFLLSESYLLKAYRYLVLDGRLDKCLDEIKNAESLSNLLPENSKEVFLQPIMNYRNWLQNSYFISQQEQAEKFEKLVSMISELAIESQQGEVVVRNTEPNINSFSSVFDAIKNLVTVKKIDHQLLNKYSLREANLIKLNLQLEGATAKIAFLTKNYKAAEVSIINLKNLSASYLDESTPLARSISELGAKNFVIPSSAGERLEEVRLKVRELRSSVGRSN